MESKLLTRFKVLTTKAIQRAAYFSSLFHVCFAKRHKHKLLVAKSKYIRYPNVLFVFQFFNKARMTAPVLRPFLDNRCQNIVLFSDGCIDQTPNVAQGLMNGSNHYVICGNDKHEIANYRLGLSIGKSLGCDYIVLLQDDDVYDDRFFGWLDFSLEFMLEEDIAIVGGCHGCDLDPGFTYRRGERSMETAAFAIYSLQEDTFQQLGSYHRMISAKPIQGAYGYPCIYAATVYRAPEIISIKIALELGFFPAEFEPYQYDDDFNAFKAWTSGFKVLLCPCPGRRTVARGGMRVYNNITANSRPAHFTRNWNFVLDYFSGDIDTGRISNLVREANAFLLDHCE